MKTKLLLLTFLICLLLNLQAQDTIHVPADYSTIQEAIDTAMNDDVVMVDQGIYYENIFINSKAITVTSNYICTLDSADIYNTIIDGSQPADTNEASVVAIIGLDTTSVICGFTIRNGTGTLLISDRFGGGIICNNSVKIIHNRIIENSVRTNRHAHGGGIWAEGSGTSSIIIIRDNIIENNLLENTHSDYMSWGSGIGVYNGNFIIENNIIRKDTAYGRPYGVGIYFNRSIGIIRNNLITDNIGHHQLANKSRGGGMYLVNNYNKVVVSNNEITHNQLINNVGFVESGGGIEVLNTDGYDNNILIDRNTISDNSALYGGGIAVTEISNIEISNNIIHSNESGSYGAGVCFKQLSTKNTNIEYESHVASKRMTDNKNVDFPVIVNNTIVGNTSDVNGAGIAALMDSEYLLFNNIIYNNLVGPNDNEIYIDNNCYIYLNNNNIDTTKIFGNVTWQGANNINADPKFIYLPNGDFHLWGYSPCAGTGIDSIEVNGNFYYSPKYDFDGNPRPNPMYLHPDMGAFEVDEINPGIGEYVNNQNSLIDIYPNPVRDYFTIELPEKLQINSIRIFNVQGSLIKDYMVTNAQCNIDVRDLQEGFYILKAYTENGFVTGKMVKQ